MLKRLLKDSAIYGGGRIFAVLLGFAILPILTKNLTAAQYGIVDLLVLCITLLNFSIALEVSQAVPRFLGEAETPHDRSLYVSTAMLFSGVMYAIAGTLIYIFYEDIAQMLFGTAADARLILFLIPWFVFHGLNYFITNQLRWENKPLGFVILKTLNGVLMLLAVIWLVTQKNMGLQGVVFSYIFSLSISSVIGVTLLVYLRVIRPHFCTVKLKEMLIFSFPLVPSGVAVFLQNYIDRIMITNMMDLSNLGLYSFAFKIASAVTLVSMTFQMSVTSLIYQLYKEKDTPLNIAKSFNIYLLFVFIAIIGICLFTPEVFYFLVGKSFYSSAYLIPVLCFSFIFSSIIVFAPGLALAKKTKLIAIINLIGMLINVVLNFVLIKLFGLMGAAVATVISLAIVSFIIFVVGNRHYKIPYFYFRIAIGTIITVASVFVASYNQKMGEFSVQELLIKIAFCGFISVVLFLVLNFRKPLQNSPLRPSA